jgi:uncharacterized protein YheU (UPF0270 family)
MDDDETETRVAGAVAEPVVVPHAALSAEALRGVLVEFVTREGTDYGHVEHSLDAKVDAVRRQLEAGLADLVFDPSTETTHLVPRGIR